MITVIAITLASLGSSASAVAGDVHRTASTSSVALDPSATGLVATADLTKFQAGNIISDAVFFDKTTMSEAQIQTFLQGKVGSCQAGYTCLKDWYDTSRTTTADAMCGAYSGGVRERASTIIHKVAQACGINPQVILVMLQKEQGLVTHTWPSDWRYTIAMGQGCPDTAACDTRYYGFFNQVYGAAWQLKRYANPPGTSQYFTWYAPGKTWNVRWHPNAGCGSSPVTIVNQATADLYYYTPYQPNAAALRAGYGEGDSCSSYGNRNFYQYFTDWFGSTQTASAERSPFGGYNLVVERGQVTVQGWALDPDQPSAQLTVTLAMDGQADWARFTANSSRPDVGAAYPGYGDHHGMESTHQISGGDHTVCVTVRNVGLGSDKQLGCSPISVESASPQGGTSAEMLAGGVRLTGWTLDLDTTSPLAVHVYVDGVASAYTADAFRPDVGRVYPGYGDNHGIDISLPLAVGKHAICTYGINVARGVNNLLGCHDVDVTASGDPVGALESVIAQPGGIQVKGWALDPNTHASIGVHVYRGSAATALDASAARQDLPAKYADLGTAHGFDGRIGAPAGKSQVCAYGLNTGFGSNSLLGCRTVTVMSGSPFGGIDVTTQSGSVRLRGWTIDPDTVDAIPVHVYIDGKPQAITAEAQRGDVGAVYPGYGPLHGIDATFDLSAGRHTLCAYGINTAAGSNALLGCADFVVPSGSPFGGTDVTVSGRDVRLRGWSIDPDTAAPIPVHVYVDGIGAALTTAGVTRKDVGAAYPAYGSNHGIDTTFVVEPGNHQICSYAINTGPGANTLLACQSVTIR
ncbi:hypothetical protein [Microbacterium sp. LWH3-1.2]|uniref:hypothetical protein n=1 Tax=Microbacterium sp. LWH3-1.2 TaxID=3135256 RepID=UPI003415633B